MNQIIHSDENFYVSYLEQRSEFAAILDDFCHIVGDRPEPKDLPETALCIRTDKPGLSSVRFLILYGDHREAYAKLIPDLAACLTYFKDNINQISHSSETPIETNH